MTSYRDILEKYDLHPRRRFGQNFLIDPTYLDAIVNAAEIDPDDTVIEIGAGLGNLTTRLAAKAGRVVAIEFDRDMVRALRGEIALPNVEIIKQDALRVDYRAISGSKAKVVANLPYNIATEIIFRLLDARECLSTMLLMTQFEVARRITAEVDTKNYGVLTLMTNLWAETDIAITVPAGAFRPKPKVDSAVVRFKLLYMPKVDLKDEALFKRIVRGAFQRRRKTLLNALAGSDLQMDRDQVKAWLDDCGISPQRRPETLQMEEYARLSNSIRSMGT